MSETLLLLLIPALPLASAIILLATRLNRLAVSCLALSSIGLAALAVLIIQLNTASDFSPIQESWGTWLEVDSVTLNFAFYLDGLSLMMISIICGVGWLIHLFSVAFMAQDTGYQRYFGYLNLFVAAMLILVLADNLLLLYLGWEGVGLCSYLLIGFWHSKRANNMAANKAFIMTRIGDTAMLIGLLLLFWQFGSLDINHINQQALDLPPNSSLVNVSCLLLFIGAAGKSAQFPLQNWLPDAMAGPTPVSALIHAATMVTAGIYLIARNATLFGSALEVLNIIAIVGTITLLLGASAAMVQSDLKRILAYSTISQLGYMFLALGVGANAAASFHLMTHAFFKALLFLAAGALIYCLSHQHNIYKMGGLAKKMPWVSTAFIIGCAALSALPLLSGFFSKELILSHVIDQGHPWLWYGAVLGGFLTAFYSARLILLVFFGPIQQAPDRALPKTMAIVMASLILLSIFGGMLPESITRQFPASTPPLSLITHYLPIASPFLAIALAYWCWQRGVFTRSITSPIQKTLHTLLLNGWQFDQLYHLLFVRPYFIITQLNRHDIIDGLFRGIEVTMIMLHRLCSKSQTGSLRLYNATIIVFIVISLAWLIIGGTTA